MKSDIEIARSCNMKPIEEVAATVGIPADALEHYGKYMAKVPLSLIDEDRVACNRLVLVSSISPTRAGIGKTTVSIGLSMALNRIGKRSVLALREPSLGPCFGMKGGAAGGGYAQVVPMEKINLHFTGDFHAITSAHNMIAALLDNYIYQHRSEGFTLKQILWKRVLDVNDRSLRNIVTGLGASTDGLPTQSGFDITPASEIMAALCLADSEQDLRRRIENMVLGITFDDKPFRVRDLGVAGAITVLLMDAIKPNLVQTLEGTAAFVHGGPFANIAHGCNSVLATSTALRLADYVVTEAGFGADLGAEKFLDIKTPNLPVSPSAVVIVATIRALKMNGGVAKDALSEENVEAVRSGFANLERHVENMRKFGVPVVVAINEFVTDTEAEIAALKELCASIQVPVELASVWADGADGGLALAESVVETLETSPANYTRLYDNDLSVEEKITKIAQEIYRADNVVFEKKAKTQIAQIVKNGWDKLPVCMAKTQYSFSDDPSLLGAPSGFDITIRELVPKTGAGFIVALTGEVMTMPGLPKRPAALNMDVAEDGTALGLF